MTKKPVTTPNPTPVVEEEQFGADILLEKVKPYLSQIGLFTVLALLGLVVTTLFLNSRSQSNSRPWQDFTSARSAFAISGNTDSLTQVAAEHPGTAAAMWALQRAGDVKLQEGIGALAEDRAAGFKQIAEAKECFQQVIDAPQNIKKPLLQQASVFSMAYASESLGEFEEAGKYYNQLLKSAPDSHFSAAATRGVARVEDPQFAAAYKKFKDWEVDTEEAPGPQVPDRPDIAFPEFEVPADESEESADTEKSDGEAAAETEMATEEPAKEQPEVKPAEPEAVEESALVEPAVEPVVEAATETEVPATDKE